MAKRRRREYLILLDKSKLAADTAIDSFNSVFSPYRNEATLLLLANAWELLAKACLLHARLSIGRGNRGESISAQVAVSRIRQRGFVDEHPEQVVQQIISLRNEAAHRFLPEIPEEIMHHLLFFGCKFFRDLVCNKFPTHAKDLNRSYLSLSFTNLTTYTDRVQRIVSRMRKNGADKKPVWLLERGVAFDGGDYLTMAQFERKFRGKPRILPHLAIGNSLKEHPMVRVVPIEAPRNFTADITLRKGSPKDTSLPVVVTKTDMNRDYPYLTNELASVLGKSPDFAAKASSALNLKGDPKYHQSIRSSRSGFVQRYSESAKSFFERKLKAEPDFSPYKASIN